MQKVEIYTEYIKLEQFLKIADIVSTGGEAKMFLLTNEIMVNGEYENRRGRKRAGYEDYFRNPPGYRHPGGCGGCVQQRHH